MARLDSTACTECRERGACAGSRCRVLLQRAASAGHDDAAREALGALIGASWQPVRRLALRGGFTGADADDVTQAYFTRFVEKDWVRQARGWGGCFQPFLRSSVRHFLSNQRDRDRAKKRGGARTVSLDGLREDRRPEPADPLTPELLLDRERARAILDHALATLERRLASDLGSGRADRFHRLVAHLRGDPAAEPYRTIAADWGVGEAAVRVAVLRLRRQLLTLLRELHRPSAAA